MSAFSTPFDVSDLDGRNGFVVERSTRIAGDINGDGIKDFLISNAGNIEVVFGSKDIFRSGDRPSNLDGNNGFTIDGSGFNLSVSDAGDLNGDGIDDLVAGAANSTTRYRILGSRERFDTRINLSELDESSRFVDEPGGYGGSAFTNIGDINGDGFGDALRGQFNPYPFRGEEDYTAEIYVVFGSADGIDEEIELSTLDGSNGFVINGADSDVGSLFDVSSSGDINGDGIDDAIVSSRYFGSFYDIGPTIGTGTTRFFDVPSNTYVIFGSRDRFDARLDVAELDGTNGFAVEDVGTSVSGTGDINGDGIDDLIASGGVGGFDSNGSPTYVVFGSRDRFSSRFERSTFNGDNGFVIEPGNYDTGAYEFGLSVVDAGDINGDGVDDVVITSSRDRYVIFGRIDELSLSLANSNLTEGTTATATVTRSTPATNDLIVTLDNSDSSEIVVPQTVTIAAGESQVSFDVTAVADGTVDGNQTATITATATANGLSQSKTSISVVDSSRPDIPSPFPDTLNLSALDGSNGLAINGIKTGDFSGSAVSGAGDVNGDGFDDVIISARRTSPDGREYTTGQSYVVFGSGSSFDSALELSELNGSNGIIINGIDEAGEVDSVSDAGDVNGDGFDDVIIGVKLAGRAGQSYVVFGSGDDFGSVLELSELDGSNGFVINGAEAGDLAGASVSGAGDVNGDGFDDVIIEAQGGFPGLYVDKQPKAYVVFGSGGAFSESFELSDIDGSNGFVFNSFAAEFVTSSVSGVGDINGDGFDDVALSVSNLGTYTDRTFRSEQYIVFGSDRSDISSSLTGFFIYDTGVYGGQISGAGDINGDGFDDVLVGLASENESYVVFGSSQLIMTTNITLSQLSSDQGFVLSGFEGDNNGSAVSNAGDVNNDGIGDIIIGTNGSDAGGLENTGKSYIVFGSNEGFSETVGLANEGFAINGIGAYDLSGSAVSNAGDINGDGVDDVIVGASNANPNGKVNAGQSYILFGRTDLSFSLASRQLAEGATTTGTLIRNTEDTPELTVALNSSDPTAASVPATVTFAAGQREAIFEVRTTDDTLSQGTQTPTISATASGLTSGSIRLEILDDDAPSFTLSLSENTISEDGSTIGTLTRNTDISSPLGVTLSSTDPTAATVPQRVTFAPNQQQITFLISGVDEGLIDGTQTTTILAIPSGFANPRQASLSVTNTTSSNATIFVDAENIIRGNAFFAGATYQGILLSSTDDSAISPDDIIVGTEGNDNIWSGRQGNDVVDGNGGNDFVGIGGGNATVTTGAGNDFVYSITNSSGNNIIDLGEGTNNLWVLGGNNRITAGAGNDVIGLGTGADIVKIDGGDNVIYRAASGSNDGDKDILTGAGDDYMELGTGDDLIDAGAGLNTLFGGEGADTFTVRRGAYNFLGDFELGTDKIKLADISFSDLIFFQGSGEKANNAYGFVRTEGIFEVVDATVEQLQTSDLFV